MNIFNMHLMYSLRQRFYKGHVKQAPMKFPTKFPAKSPMQFPMQFRTALLCLLFAAAISMTGCSRADEGQTGAPEAGGPASSSSQTSETASSQQEESSAPAPDTDAAAAADPLEVPTVTAAAVTFTDTDEIVYTTANVNIRSGADTDNAILGIASKGSPVHRTGYSDTWSRVEIAGQICYMSSAYLTATAPQPNVEQPTNSPDPQQTGAVYGEGDRVVAIDAGHQRKSNSEKEPVGPGASEMKAKVTGGATGAVTRQNEYELNLTVSQKLRDELVARGYKVVMIREGHDVNLSNKERADIANESGAQTFVRIHANSADASSAHGALTMCPTANNPYVADLHDQSLLLSQKILDQICAYTGARNRGVSQTDTMSGINWAKIPVTIVEMGFLSNPDEDKALADDAYQDKIVKGIADGLDLYYQESGIGQ